MSANAHITHKLVLLVEDDADVVSYLVPCLETAGWQVVHVNREDQALEQLQGVGHSLFNAVILDANLLGGTYVPVLRRLVEVGFKGPIIATSGISDTRKEQLRNGCTHEVENKLHVLRLFEELANTVACLV